MHPAPILKTCILTLLILLSVNVCHAQITLHFGPEIGYALNQVPARTQLNGVTIQQTQQTPSPILGMLGMLVADETWVVRGGIQYQWLGKKSLYNQSGIGYFYRDIRQQNFQKLCVPLGVGVVAGTPEFKMSIVLGYRATAYVYGHVREEVAFQSSDGNTGGTFLSYNPFTETPGEIQMDRPVGQFWGSLSAFIHQRVHISGNLAIGRRYSYRQNDDLETEMVFGNSDLFLTFGYLLGKR